MAGPDPTSAAAESSSSGEKKKNGSGNNSGNISGNDQHQEDGGEPQAATAAAGPKNNGGSGNRRRRNRAHHGDGSSGRPGRRRHSLTAAARDPRDEPQPTPAATSSAGLVHLSKNRSPSPIIDFDGLSRPSIGTRERLEEGEEEQAKRQTKIRDAVRTILECIGEDPERAGLLGTPDRYAKALLFLTQGYQQNVRDIVNNAIFHEGHRELVIVKDIEVFSLCEHHMVPFTGKIHVGYIPYHSVIGLSKIPRIVNMFSRRLQIQERLTKEVANAIMEVLQPQGVAVVMESSHLCMAMRGVEKTTAKTITSCVLGCFESKEKTRNEFLSLIGINR